MRNTSTTNGARKVGEMTTDKMEDRKDVEKRRVARQLKLAPQVESAGLQAVSQRQGGRADGK